MSGARQCYPIYGSVNIPKKLAACDELETACRNTVARAMREMGPKSRVLPSDR